MNEIIIGLLGGGVLVEVLNLVLNRRASRRQMDATSLGTEVTALEAAISTLQGNLERTTAYYQSEIERLQGRIRELEGIVASFSAVSDGHT